MALNKKSNSSTSNSAKRIIAITSLQLLFLLIGVAKIAAQTGNDQKVKERMEVRAEKYTDPADTSLHEAIKKGLIPVPLITTEPALGGFGGGLAVGYLHTNRNSLRKNTPPTISGVFGGMSLNNSWLVGVGHSHSFNNDHIRYVGAIAKANVNMTFYVNQLLTDGDFPFKVNLNAWGTMQKFSFRIGETDLFIGPQYIYFKTKNSLDIDTDFPELDSLVNNAEGQSSLGLLGLFMTLDSRDNFLSPNKGFYVGGIVNYNSTFLGGKTDYWDIALYGKFYFPVGKKVFGGARYDLQFTSGDVPFYSKPFVGLRGVPAMRYQGNEVAVVETQWRWKFYKNWSVLGFTGTGKAMDSLSDFSDSQWIYNYGIGGRYDLIQLFGVRIGADVAWSNEDFAWYISVGSSF